MLLILAIVVSADDVPKKPQQPQPQQQLPNTSGIDGELTAKLGVDQFFSLWLVFNNDEISMSDKPFTIFAPKNSEALHDNRLLLQHPDIVKKLLLDHVVLGYRLELANASSHLSVSTLGGRTIRITSTSPPKKESEPSRPKLRANNATVVEARIEVPHNGILVVLDKYLFEDDLNFLDKKPTERLDNTIDERTTSAPVSEKVVTITTMAQVEEVTKPSTIPETTLTTEKATTTTSTTTPSTTTTKVVVPRNATFVDNVLQVMSFLKSGVRVFQHFLSRSNVTRLLKEGEEYTVFVPTDHAFQRWHPIDWGFYPFSVPEFTETVIINHFVSGRLKQDAIQNGLRARTLGGRDIVFRKTPLTLAVNAVSIVKGDTPVSNGNIMFIGEVLFVSESVVSRLHQQHRDKETPPLLAFPWFGAQFLSHAFLALERDRRFSHITRFLNLADLAPHVAGTGYTFFVPTDTAFEELGLDKMPDNYLSTGEGLDILLNHFVKGRLYDRDLKDGIDLHTLGNRTINIHRDKEVVNVNEAKVVESEVFVYNLGTMFYIDRILFVNRNTVPSTGGHATTTTRKPTSNDATTTQPTTTRSSVTTPISTEGTLQSTTTEEPETENVPEELLDTHDTNVDVLLADDATNLETTDGAETSTNEYISTESVTVLTEK